MPRVEEVKARRERLAADFPERLTSTSAFQKSHDGVSITCDNCKINSFKGCYCVDCKMFMCLSCLTAHETLQVTFARHTILPAAEIRPELYEVLLKREYFCLENYHFQSTTNYFCLNCQSCICPDCVVTTHLGHELLALDEAADIEAEKIILNTELAREKGNVLIDAILQFEKSIEELESNAEIANHGVCEATEEIISDIRERALETHASFVTTHAIEQAKINIANEKMLTQSKCHETTPASTIHATVDKHRALREVGKYQQIIAESQERQREAVEYLEYIENTRVTRLEKIDDAKRKAKSLLEQVNRSVDFVESVVMYGSSSYIMQNRENLHKRVKDLCETEVPQHHETSFIKFTAASEAGQRLGYILTEEIDLNLTTLEGLDETLVAGVKAVMMLCPKTTESNTINQPDLKGLVEVLIEPAPEVADLAISDKKDGKLEIHFTPKVPGAYSIEVKISGDRLLICPASVEVTENEVALNTRLFSKTEIKREIFKKTITERGEVKMLKELPGCFSFACRAVRKPTEVICSLWSPRIRSPSLGPNEIIVSSVVELSLNERPSTSKDMKEFHGKVMIAISHSATDLKGYELVVKKLTNEENKDWEDLETRSVWRPSDLESGHFGRQRLPDWLFPFVEAEIGSYGSFAVVWRLKSFKFNKPSLTTPQFTCSLQEYPGLSVIVPQSSLPSSENFSLTLKVQEAPCDAFPNRTIFGGPILHISCNPKLGHLSTPATLKLPVTLREDTIKLPYHSPYDLRIFCRRSEDEEPEWAEMTEELGRSVDLENGIVTFEVYHLSEFWAWLDWMKKPAVSMKTSVRDLYRRLMAQEARFLACLCDIGKPGDYLLTLCCFPFHLKNLVQEGLSSTYRVCCQGEENSLKPLCREDHAFVSLSEAFIVVQKGQFENFFLKFLGNEPFQRSVPVRVVDLSCLQVDFYKWQEHRSDKEMLCSLFVIPTSQAQGSYNFSFPSTSQERMRHKQQDGQLIPRDSQASISPRGFEPEDSSISIDRILRITILADEWSSLKGGLSTFNRELAIHLARNPNVDVTFFVPHGVCGREVKETAKEKGVTIIEAEQLTACTSQEQLFFPPKDPQIDIIIGHGVKLGRQAQVIKNSHRCKWVHVVHTVPEQLGMFKDYPKAIAKGEEKNLSELELCAKADLVLPVGPKLESFYSHRLRCVKKEQDVMKFTPGIIEDLTDAEQSPHENDMFQVLVFGRGDNEDFRLKGYDIVAEAFALNELKKDCFQIKFVGASSEQQENFAERILQYGVRDDQLSFGCYVEDRKLLKQLLVSVDLVLMHSRTEGFGFTALEALSAGVPILVSKSSGFAKALSDVEFGDHCVVESEKAKDWSDAIIKVFEKKRGKRLKEIQSLRKSYEQTYSWKRQCETLVDKMWNKVFTE